MHSLRRLTVLACAALLGAGLISASPAQAYEGLQGAYADKWAYTDVSRPTSGFIDQPGSVPVGAWRDGQGRFHASRFYFSINLSRGAGQKVVSAKLLFGETAVTDCGVETFIELWRTGPITPSISWSRPPQALEKVAVLSSRLYACPGVYEHDIAAVYDAALARGETRVTFELRVRRDQESLDRHGRKFHPSPWTDGYVNRPPVISEPAVEWANPGCGTASAPTFGRGFETLTARLTDPDPMDYRHSGQFALWPVDQPQQRVERITGGPGVMKAEFDLSVYPHGTRLAWSARGYDNYHYTPWTEPCYLTIDEVAPANPPVVTSLDYGPAWPGTGGPGVPGRFTFDAQGDPDVAGYVWGDYDWSYTRVDAPAPGAPVTITYTPQRAGEASLHVSAVDRAGNRGPQILHHFFVRDTLPRITVDVAGVGLPSRITMRTVLPGATGFGYRIGDGPEVRFPAESGAGSVPYTFPANGVYEVLGRVYIGDEAVGSDTTTVTVSDAPGVWSESYEYGQAGVVGRPGVFTFTPRRNDVVAYHYHFSNDPAVHTVAARPDGTAVLDWTPSQAGYHTIIVESESAGGVRSAADNSFSFSVNDNRPSVYSGDLVNYPRRDGAGVRMEFNLRHDVCCVNGFVYSFDDGPQQTVESGYSTHIQWTPPTAGDHVIHVRARYTDGSLSPVRDWQFQVWNGPVITSTEYPIEGGGGPNVPGTFHLAPGMPNVVDYVVTLPDGTEQTVAADALGRASITYTPPSPGYHTIIAVSRDAAGTLSQVRRHDFRVLDTSLSISGYYSSYWPNGGVGQPGPMQVYTEVYERIAEYEFWVNDGPVQSLTSAGRVTEFAIVPDRSGSNVLHMRYRTVDGAVSAVTEYPFLVAEQSAGALNRIPA